MPPKSGAEREDISHNLDESVYTLTDTDPSPDSPRPVDATKPLFPKWDTYTLLGFCFIGGRECLCWTDDFVPPQTYYVIIYSDGTWEKLTTGGGYNYATPTRIGGGTWTKSP